ncbi:UNVERIFIED_CONTAM: hypothetical protein NCL1_25724 [Trichonephila clavipes]
MDDETYMPFYDVPTRQESKVWVFEDDPMPTILKSQRAMEKKYGINQSHQVGRIKDSNSKLNLRGSLFHSEEDIDVAINVFFHQFQEMNGFRHLICGKFVYKSALMLEGTTLNTPKIL